MLLGVRPLLRTVMIQLAKRPNVGGPVVSPRPIRGGTVRLPLPTYSPVPDSIAFNRAFPIRASGRTADPFVQRSN